MLSLPPQSYRLPLWLQASNSICRLPLLHQPRLRLLPHESTQPPPMRRPDTPSHRHAGCFSASSSFSFFFSIFFFLVCLLLAWCVVLGVWVVRKCGKAKEIYIYSYFGMFFDYIHDFFFFFCLVFGC